jgi:hypothetical protein
MAPLGRNFGDLKGPAGSRIRAPCLRSSGVWKSTSKTPKRTTNVNERTAQVERTYRRRRSHRKPSTSIRSLLATSTWEYASHVSSGESDRPPHNLGCLSSGILFVTRCEEKSKKSIPGCWPKSTKKMPLEPTPSRPRFRALACPQATAVLQ